MKMKHRYPLGTVLTFLITVAGIDRILTLTGEVVFHGLNEEGKEGVGIRLLFDGETDISLRQAIKERCVVVFGERLAERIAAVTEAQYAEKG